MNYGYHAILTLVLILLQTAVLPTVPFLDRFYDLLIPFVIYLGLFRPTKEGLIVILLAGTAMDGLSGGPFGLFLTSFVWTLLGVKWVITFLHARSTLIMIFVVALGVLFENIVSLGTIGVLMPDAQFPLSAPHAVFEQLVLALITGPFFLMLIDRGHDKWCHWVRGLSKAANGH